MGIIYGLCKDNGKENGNYYRRRLVEGPHLARSAAARRLQEAASPRHKLWSSSFCKNGQENGNYRDYIGLILGLYWGLYGDNGQENGNY